MRFAHMPLLAAAVLLLAAAGLLQAAGVVTGGWPTLLPAYLGIFATPFLVWALWAGRRLRRPQPPWAARHASTIGLPLLVGALAVHAQATGVESAVTRPMTWEVVPGATGAWPEVVLRFRDAPDHRIGLRSPEVAAHLQERAGPIVEVEFVLTRDWGRLRSHRIARIGSLTRWRSQSGWSGCTGDCAGSPW